MRNILKFVVGVAVLGGLALGAFPAAAAPDSETVNAVQVREDDVFYGSADAPVTIVEYASLTCPHCANFHKESLPQLKEGPIAEGKARLIYRDFPLDGLALRASALARCGGPDRRLAIIGLLFESQPRWTKVTDLESALTALSEVGKVAGLAPETSRACMEDEGMLNRIVEEAQEGETKHKVRSTPSFVIDDQLFRGGVTAEDMIEVIDARAE